MMIWQRTKINARGQTTIPQSVRERMNLLKGDEILWEDVKPVIKSDGSIERNFYIVKLGIKRYGRAEVG